MEFYSWFLYGLCLLFYFIIGYSLLTLMLFRDFEIKNKTPLFVFSLIFSFSAMLLQMIIFEIMKIGTEEMRYWKWIITLCTLTYATIFVIPSCLLFKFLIKLKIRRKFKIIMAFVLSIAYLWIMLKLLANETLTKQPEHEAGIFAMFLPITQVDFLGRIGIFFLAILSGFGAVNCPFTFFNVYDKNIIKMEKSVLEDKILVTLEHIKKIKVHNHALRNKLKQYPFEKENEGFSLFRWIFGKKPNLIESELIENEKEIKILKETHNEAFDDYCEFIEESKKLQLSNSLYGKFLNFLAKILSIYCLYRIIISTINVILGRKRGLDPVNRLLRILIIIMNINMSNEEVGLICSNVSFVIFGYLIFINVRSFANNILQFSRIFMKSYLSKVISSDLLVYLLSEILGIYFISTLMMMQSSFPYQFKGNINTLLGDIDYNKHYDRFDTIFIISSLGSIILIGLNMTVKRSKYSNDKDDDDKDK